MPTLYINQIFMAYISYFSIMKKLLDVIHGKLINKIGRHGILDQYLWTSVRMIICVVNQLKNNSYC